MGLSLPLIHAGVTQLLIEEPRGGINNEERKHWVIIRAVGKSITAPGEQRQGS